MGVAFGEVTGGILREVEVTDTRVPLTLTDSQMRELRPVKFLGSGTTASAYLRDDGRVVKFTLDHQDVSGFSNAKGMRHIGEVYAFYKLPQTLTVENTKLVRGDVSATYTGPVYSIVMKQYAPFPEGVRIVLKSLMNMFYMGGRFQPDRPDFQMYVLDPLQRNVDRAQKDGIQLPDDPEKYVVDFYKEVLATQKALRAVGVEMNDLHAGNIMYDTDSGDWVFIDLGRSRRDVADADAVATPLQGLARWFRSR